MNENRSHPLGEEDSRKEDISSVEKGERQRTQKPFVKKVPIKELSSLRKGEWLNFGQQDSAYSGGIFDHLGLSRGHLLFLNPFLFHIKSLPRTHFGEKSAKA